MQPLELPGFEVRSDESLRKLAGRIRERYGAGSLRHLEFGLGQRGVEDAGARCDRSVRLEPHHTHRSGRMAESIGVGTVMM